MKPAALTQFRIVQCLVVCCTLLTLSSCQKEGDPIQSQPTGGVIMPMKVGNQWVYKGEELDSAGRVFSTTFDTMKIVSVIVMQNETWYFDNNGIQQTNRADGRWILSGTPYLVEKYPARLNETYPIRDSVTGITARVRSTDQTVVVSLGSFSTYTYRWTRNSTADPIGDFTYAPNTGLVKSEMYTRSSQGFFVSSRRELISKTLN